MTCIYIYIYIYIFINRYSNIEKMKGIAVLKNLEVLYMSNCKVKDWKEFEQLKDLPNLKELNFIGNPLELYRDPHAPHR